MRKSKHNSAIAAHLRKIGILESGTPEEIRAAKRSYWRDYDRALKLRKREQKRTFHISFGKSQMEHLRQCTVKFQITVPAYLKHLLDEDRLQTHTYPNAILFASILQLLQQYKQVLQRILQQDKRQIQTKEEQAEILLRDIHHQVISLIKLETDDHKKRIEKTK